MCNKIKVSLRMSSGSGELRMSSWTLDPFLHPLCWPGCSAWMRGAESDGQKMRWPSKCYDSPSIGQLFGWTLLITVLCQFSFLFQQCFVVLFLKLLHFCYLHLYILTPCVQRTKDNLWESVLSTMWSCALKSGPQAWGHKVLPNEPFHLSCSVVPLGSLYPLSHQIFQHLQGQTEQVLFPMKEIEAKECFDDLAKATQSSRQQSQTKTQVPQFQVLVSWKI